MDAVKDLVSGTFSSLIAGVAVLVFDIVAHKVAPMIPASWKWVFDFVIFAFVFSISMIELADFLSNTY